jgi:SAM-dependent methyltransferase
MNSSDPSPSNYTQQNRRAWNEIANVREKTMPPAEFFAKGGSTLDPRVVTAAQALYPDLRGLRLIHLQCATGEDTLSWAGMGLQAAGVDISDVQIELAKQKAAASGLSAAFVAADVYDLPGALPQELPANYDLVFTGGGAIVWLPDIRRWAQVVASLLQPGGRLLLNDIHPVTACLWTVDEHLQITSDYFGRGQAEVDTGWSHFEGAEDAREIKYEFNWPLGDIVTALAQAGLMIERLEEYPGGPEWRFGEKQAETLRLPGDFLLIARK